MCGICGIINLNSSDNVDSDTLKKMGNVLHHRGPDDEGYYCKNNIGLGMRRLSIIDLNTGKQPLFNENGSICVIFNGEIYNFKELQDELIEKGHTFSTKSDTEVIVHAYEEFGYECVSKLNGMFAFAVLDKRKNLLLLARDRLGKKPLYYFHDSKCFLFASEIKALLQSGMIKSELDMEAIDLFLTYEYIPAPWSIFKNILKLPPGHILILSNDQCCIKSYWDISAQNELQLESNPEDQLLWLLNDSIRLRLRSDVPLGVFLSGGVDSSAVLAMMSNLTSEPIRTFSIGFNDNSYNELPYARRVSRLFNCDHHEIIIEPNVVQWINDLIYFVDEPFGDTSIFPTYLVSRMARKDVKVVLSGDGGDEVFAGYETYIADKIGRLYHKIPSSIRGNLIQKALGMLPVTQKKKGLLNKSRRFLQGCILPESLQHVRWMMYITEMEKRELYSEELNCAIDSKLSYEWMQGIFKNVNSGDPLRQQQYVDIKTFLADDILVKVDRMSMANSLEVRSPLLDYRLVEFAMMLPSSLKLRGFKSKYIFKKALNGLLPGEILHRKKEGFSSPLKNWIKNELKPMMLDLLSSEVVKKRGYFRAQYIENLISEHLADKENHAHKLWPLMVFELWHQQYLN
jgi:asparagine synthase (glutamine-hydrolysing)